jgi:hypothetical protein
MAMSMDQMQMMMAQMHAQNYSNDMKLAQYFQGISGTFTSMAQSEYQMYLMHSGQAQGATQQTPGTASQPGMPVVPSQPTMPGM